MPSFLVKIDFSSVKVKRVTRSRRTKPQGQTILSQKKKMHYISMIDANAACTTENLKKNFCCQCNALPLSYQNHMRDLQSHMRAVVYG